MAEGHVVLALGEGVPETVERIARAVDTVDWAAMAEGAESAHRNTGDWQAVAKAIYAMSVRHVVTAAMEVKP